MIGDFGIRLSGVFLKNIKPSFASLKNRFFIIEDDCRIMRLLDAFISTILIPQS